MTIEREKAAPESWELAWTCELDLDVLLVNKNYFTENY